METGLVVLFMSGKDEQPEKRYEEYDLKCPHCGEMQWKGYYVQHGVVYYDPANDVLDYDDGYRRDIEWDSNSWKCDFCDRLAPTHIVEYMESF